MAEYCISKDILSKTVDNEEVLVDLESGTYFGLNSQGTFIWNLLKKGSNQQAILNAMFEEFLADETQIRADVDEFLKELLDKKWITKVG